MAAALLLLWTAAELFDHGLCVHDHQRLGSHGRAVFEAAPGGAGAAADAEDDCFCCSHMVEVGMSFDLSLFYATEWSLDDALPGRPHVTTSTLYHPPLA